jgi:glycerophosphoryl diester phosphodiesterase
LTFNRRISNFALLNSNIVIPTIVAHRGASRDAPENTLAAFSIAWEQGADAMECDVRVTLDSELVCIHDPATRRIADADFDVADSTLERLKQLDAGSWKNARFRGQKIPSLRETLGAVPAGKKVFIEIKDGPVAVPVLGRTVADSGLSNNGIVVLAFNEEVVAATKAMVPELKVFLLVDPERDGRTGSWRPGSDSILESLRRLNADGLGISDTDFVDEDFVRMIHGGGFELNVWTVDDPRRAVRHARLGVDSITTNQPGDILKALQGTRNGSGF